MSSDPSSDDRDPVERLAEEFVARHRRGDRPLPAEYAERYPQWAERIHSLFPALLLIEQHKPGVGDQSGGSGRSHSTPRRRDAPRRTSGCGLSPACRTRPGQPHFSRSSRPLRRVMFL